MGNIKLFKLYDEYQAILSLLNGKTYHLEETTKFIDITLNDGITLNILKKISDTIKYFDLNCNPFSSEYEDIIDDLESGYKDISEITSISINLDKEMDIEKIKNIQHIFLDKKWAINSTKTIQLSEGSNKINIGIIDNPDLETEIFQFINIREGILYDDVKIKGIDPEVSKNIVFYLSNNRNNNHNHFYNPYSFTISKMSGTDQEFASIIKTEFYKVMLQSLSDKEEQDTFIIRGEKNITVILNPDFTTYNYEKFLDVFRFLISHQKYTEKFIITKKVITLYVNDKENITHLDEKLPEIWKTINHYYNHYIEDNIKEFFKTKDQLLKEAMSVSKVIYEQTDKIGNSIVASIISILVLLVTTLYRSLENLNIVYASLFIIIFIIFSCGYYHIMSSSTKNRYLLTKAQFDHFISEVSLIQKNEVEVIRKTYLKEPYAELENSLHKLLTLLIGVNVVFVISFLVYICVKYNYCLC